MRAELGNASRALRLSNHIVLASQTVHQWWNSPKAMKFPRGIVDKDATDAAAPAADAEEVVATRPSRFAWREGGEDTVQAVASARPSSVTSRMKKIGLFYIDTHTPNGSLALEETTATRRNQISCSLTVLLAPAGCAPR